MNTQTPEEQLSALLDGELDTDRSRFLLRRLQHDDALASTLGRWQLAGDVLRGQGSAAASADFSARLAARLAAESPPRPQPQVAMPETAPVKSHVQQATGYARWRYFAAGAMAASFAFAAFIGLRAPETAPTPAAIATVQPPAPETIAPAAVARLEEAAPAAVSATPESMVTAPQIAAATPATQAPRPARVSRPRSAPATPASRPEPLPQVAQSSDEARDPFSPPQVAPAWPRALLPGTGSSTFNVRLESAPAAPSPFQPHPQDSQD